MPTQALGETGLIRKIEVRIQVGSSVMGGTADPVFLRLGGPAGREFRLQPARGRAFQRGKQSLFVLGGPQDTDTNVAHPELNDPTLPPLHLDAIERVCLEKRMEPLPNVRGVGEMDDRLLIELIEVELHGDAGTRRYQREGPLWLGLVSGLWIELSRVDDAVS